MLTSSSHFRRSPSLPGLPVRYFFLLTTSDGTQKHELSKAPPSPFALRDKLNVAVPVLFCFRCTTNLPVDLFIIIIFFFLSKTKASR